MTVLFGFDIFLFHFFFCYFSFIDVVGDPNIENSNNGDHNYFCFII